MSTLLSISNLSVRFDTVRGMLSAVKDVTLQIKSGESVGVVGESGSGKSVLSRTAMGLLDGKNVHKTGVVKFNDVDLSQISAEELRNLWGTEMAMMYCLFQACTKTGF